MSKLEFKDFIPLISHQIGIVIKDKIKQMMLEDNGIIVLDFADVDICTDSFLTQITSMLSDEIGYETYKERIRFANLNAFLKDLVKYKLYSLK